MPTGNTKIETSQAPATAGAFLDQKCLNEFLISQEDTIREALSVSDDTDKLRDVVGMARGCPKLVAEDIALDAAGRLFDKEAIWRRYTDHFSEAAAIAFPERPIFPISSREVYYTDHYKMFSLSYPSGNAIYPPIKTIYHSLLTASEDRQGAELASTEAWQSFLYRVLLRIRQFRTK